MGKKIGVIILVFLCIGGGILFFSANRKSRKEVHLRMTEIAEETLAAIPTETPVPTATPLQSDTPEPEAPTETLPPEPTAIPTHDPEEWQNWPELPEAIDPAIKAMYFEGIADGNDPKRFSKVGDSNTMMPSFFGCFDSGADTGYVLGDHAYLQEVIDQFQWSFARNSRAARNGATAYDMDVYHWYEDDVCWPYESALSCEYRLFTPSIAFIGFGTNDALLPIERYEEHLRSLVEKTLSRKIVPILYSKADDLEGDGSFNKAAAAIANEYHVPFWNLWKPMSELPNNGLRQGDVHPTANDINLCNFANGDLEQFGWTVRNYSAIRALDRVWRLLNDLPLHEQ
ncbi:MAG: hypothetical protein IKP86_01665 [Anaerolineaceae bacterium]|nr:hypothetical protein [Anaerolineaceae bacterium]